MVILSLVRQTNATPPHSIRSPPHHNLLLLAPCVALQQSQLDLGIFSPLLVQRRYWCVDAADMAASEKRLALSIDITEEQRLLRLVENECEVSDKLLLRHRCFEFV